MGGPGASVLLRDPLTTQQSTDLQGWLQSMICILEVDASQVFSFWFKADVLPEAVSPCLFYLSVERPMEMTEEDERQQILAHLGYLPQQSIAVSSGCNQKSDHRTLGYVMLHLAEVYDGLINLNGTIVPSLPPVSVSKDFLKQEQARAAERKAYLQAQFKALEATLPPGTTMQDLFRTRHSDPDSPLQKISAEAEAKFGPVLPPFPPEPSLEEISAYVQEMPGRVYEVHYETGRGTRWVYHIVDRTFLRAWMNHPNFYMVK